MTSYASQKGRAQPKPALQFAQPLPDLTPAQAAEVAANRDFIREHMPEMLATIRDLVAEGCIDGWRNVKTCKLIAKK